MWAPQFHQLTDRYRVIAVDLRGHGESAVGSDGLGISRLADDLATLLTALDLRDAVVVGHSMGGMTADAVLRRSTPTCSPSGWPGWCSWPPPPTSPTAR